jgi:hypothetical protein
VLRLQGQETINRSRYIQASQRIEGDAGSYRP